MHDPLAERVRAGPPLLSPQSHRLGTPRISSTTLQSSFLLLLLIHLRQPIPSHPDSQLSYCCVDWAYSINISLPLFSGILAFNWSRGHSLELRKEWWHLICGVKGVCPYHVAALLFTAPNFGISVGPPDLLTVGISIYNFSQMVRLLIPWTPALFYSPLLPYFYSF